MALNDQALLKKWSSQCDNEDVDACWRIKFLPEHIIEAFEHVADTTNDHTAARLTEWSDKATIARWKCVIETDHKVIAAAGHGKEQRTPANNKSCHASSAPADASDSEPNEVQVISLWVKEARTDDLYKIAYCIFPGRS
jgi:hypothetical protein